MYTTIMGMIKYIQRAGFIFLLLFCLLGIRTAQSQERPAFAMDDTVEVEQREARGIIGWWTSGIENNRNSALVKTLLIVIISCLTCLVFLLIWILVNRNQMHARQIETDRLKEQFESLLFDYLTSTQKESIYKEIARASMYNYNREILIYQMRELSKSMSMMNMGGNDESKIQLRELYHRMHLDKDSIRKIYSSKWHIQIKGFRELAFMDVTEANVKLRQALKSRNNILRMEAQLALVRLNNDDPFGFLDHLTHPFTLWEQLNVHELIMVHNLPVPQFSRWTDSSNSTVVKFSLRMIQVFKQQQAAPQVAECLRHKERDIRHMAIFVCGEIQLRETLMQLKHMYKDEDNANCLAIVQAMGKMPDEMMLNFLKLVLDKEDDVQLQIESAKAISKMGEVGIAALVKLMKSEYKNYQIIIRHILDKRIN